ncbi:hypothetical protein HK096_000775, partial [Nowakowskiella sp. JEL0078]
MTSSFNSNLNVPVTHSTGSFNHPFLFLNSNGEGFSVPPDCDVYVIPKGSSVSVLPQNPNLACDSNNKYPSMPISSCNESPDVNHELKSDFESSNSQHRKILRPHNPFILYRIERKYKAREEYPNMDSREMSRIIGEQWKNEPEEVKDEFRRKASLLKRQHKQLHPDYRYKPSKNATLRGNLKMMNSKSNKRSQCPQTSTTNSII